MMHYIKKNEIKILHTYRVVQTHLFRGGNKTKTNNKPTKQHETGKISAIF